jgi:hypothetical protein
MHCFLIEHVENTDSEWKKMVPVILVVNIIIYINCVWLMNTSTYRSPA